MTAPPGWPRDLPPPQAGEFSERVTGWLLDRAPGSWRTQPVLRRHPRALALLVSDGLESELEGLRRSYASARRRLTDVVTPADLAAILTAIEALATEVTESRRQVEQVAEALAGVRWRPRL
ncbi:MAG: hypothetical protein V9E98_15410 [Candidatus Nanopelagicales bacterium]